MTRKERKTYRKNKRRIKRVLKAVKKTWIAVPDHELGQLLENVAAQQGAKVFELEDVELVKYMKLRWSARVYELGCKRARLKSFFKFRKWLRKVVREFFSQIEMDEPLGMILAVTLGLLLLFMIFVLTFLAYVFCTDTLPEWIRYAWETYVTAIKCGK